MDEPVKLMGDEITAACVSEDQETLVTGAKDGRVTIWDIRAGFEERETIDAFRTERHHDSVQ